MKLAQRTVFILLSQPGRDVLVAAGLQVAEGFLPVYIEDSDDMGLWARMERQDGEHVVLVLWDYVLLVDFPAGPPKTMGMRG